MAESESSAESRLELHPKFDSRFNLYVDEATGFVFNRWTKEICGRFEVDLIRALNDEDKASLEKHGYAYDGGPKATATAANNELSFSDVASLGTPINDYQDDDEPDDRDLAELDTREQDEIVNRASKAVADILLMERRTERKEWLETRARWRGERAARLLSRQAATVEFNQKLIPLLESQLTNARRLVARAEELTNWVAVSTILKGSALVGFMWWLWAGRLQPSPSR